MNPNLKEEISYVRWKRFECYLAMVLSGAFGFYLSRSIGVSILLAISVFCLGNYFWIFRYNTKSSQKHQNSDEYTRLN
ncbi:hypothetical protein [Teredinibacter sp. KSP-S5-2]|uniref:hypothetical protein n=1 Tax=Teredinibacter sp. KSP-S5-2 TaxID=3034506 RepID=UPI002934122B|nr:hypothetical protein [Teredinibacter sp. KSP-S5-2]WNO08252.1 hypothetical protein P5V12_14875 [Teredinibacter sp. KSP-S5-2]